MDDNDTAPDEFTDESSPSTAALSGAGASYSYPTADVTLQTYAGDGSYSPDGLSLNGTEDGNLDGQSGPDGPDGQIGFGNGPVGSKIRGEDVARWGIQYFTALRDDDASPDATDGQSGPDGQSGQESQGAEQAGLDPASGNAPTNPGGHSGAAPFTAPSSFTFGSSGWDSFDRTLYTNDGKLSTNPGSLPDSPADQLLDTNPKIPGVAGAIDSFEQDLRAANINPPASGEPSGQDFYENYPQEPNFAKSGPERYEYAISPEDVIAKYGGTLRPAPDREATCATRDSTALNSTPGQALSPRDRDHLGLTSYYPARITDSNGNKINVGVVELASEMGKEFEKRWGEPHYQLDSSDENYAGKIGDILNNLDLGDVAVVARQGHTYMMTKDYQDQYAYVPNYNAGPNPSGKTKVWVLHTPAGR